MESKNIGLIIFSLLIFIVLCILCLFKYDKVNIELLNKTWYRYDYKTGYYEKLYFDNNKINYYIPQNGSYSTIYDKCSNYNYSRKNKSFKLDCNKEIVIEKVDEEKLVLLDSDIKKIFFNNLSSSLNYEFHNYFGVNISKYRNEKSQVLDLFKIDNIKLKEIYDSKELSKLIFVGNNCSSIECTLILDVLEKWYVLSPNNYYYDSSNIDLKEIKKINKSFMDYKEKYNGVYPFVIILNNGKIIDTYNIKCNGLDCSEYYKM